MASWCDFEYQDLLCRQGSKALFRETLHEQKVQVRYLMEWWWNFYLVNDNDVLRSYEKSWVDCSEIEKLTPEYVCPWFVDTSIDAQ